MNLVKRQNGSLAQPRLQGAQHEMLEPISGVHLGLRGQYILEIYRHDRGIMVRIC